jgi:hypothetical protein
MGNSLGAERVGDEVDRDLGGRTAVIGSSEGEGSSWHHRFYVPP